VQPVTRPVGCRSIASPARATIAGWCGGRAAQCSTRSTIPAARRRSCGGNAPGHPPRSSCGSGRSFLPSASIRQGLRCFAVPAWGGEAGRLAAVDISPGSERQRPSDGGVSGPLLCPTSRDDRPTILLVPTTLRQECPIVLILSRRAYMDFICRRSAVALDFICGDGEVNAEQSWTGQRGAIKGVP